MAKLLPIPGYPAYWFDKSTGDVISFWSKTPRSLKWAPQKAGHGAILTLRKDGVKTSFTRETLKSLMDNYADLSMRVNNPGLARRVKVGAEVIVRHGMPDVDDVNTDDFEAMGWHTCWSPDMSEAIGKVGIVSSCNDAASAQFGLRLEFYDEDGSKLQNISGYWYPTAVLDICEDDIAAGSNRGECSQAKTEEPVHTLEKSWVIRYQNDAGASSFSHVTCMFEQAKDEGARLVRNGRAMTVEIYELVAAASAKIEWSE